MLEIGLHGERVATRGPGFLAHVALTVAKVGDLILDPLHDV